MSSNAKPGVWLVGTHPDGTRLVGITLVLEVDAAWQGWDTPLRDLASTICSHIDGAGIAVTEDSRAAVGA